MVMLSCILLLVCLKFELESKHGNLIYCDDVRLYENKVTENLLALICQVRNVAGAVYEHILTNFYNSITLYDQYLNTSENL